MNNQFNKCLKSRVINFSNVSMLELFDFSFKKHKQPIPRMSKCWHRYLNEFSKSRIIILSYYLNYESLIHLNLQIFSKLISRVFKV